MIDRTAEHQKCARWELDGATRPRIACLSHSVGHRSGAPSAGTGTQLTRLLPDISIIGYCNISITVPRDALADGPGVTLAKTVAKDRYYRR